MLRFHALVHGGSGKTATPLTAAFEGAATALAGLSRLFIEPDGSFVWTGSSVDGQRWQVDGNLIDQGEVLAYVELSGCCPEPQFDALLTALGWPRASLVFQLPERGVFLDEPEFRRRAANEEGAR